MILHGEVNQTKGMIIRSFKKCRIPLALNGSQDNAVNIEGIPNYKMPLADQALGDDVEFHLESDESDDDNEDDDDDGRSVN